MGLLSAGAPSADHVTPSSEIAETTLNDPPGTLQDAGQIIARKAYEHGASYYRILRMNEQAHQFSWQASAIL